MFCHEKNRSITDILPNNVISHTLTFLTTRDAKLAGATSRLFQTNDDNKITGKLYMVGEPLVIGYYNAKISEGVDLLGSVDSKEIKALFPKQNAVRLFSTEEEAQCYAKFLRTDPESQLLPKDPISQPVIFKVQIMNKPIPEFKGETFTIKHFDVSRPSTEIPLRYVEMDVCHITRLEGKLNVDIKDDNRFVCLGTTNDLESAFRSIMRRIGI